VALESTRQIDDPPHLLTRQREKVRKDMGKKFQNQTFESQEVELDGNEFDNCTFKDCKLVYRGTAAFGFHHCKVDCEGHPIEFRDAAARTLETLKKIYHGFDFGPKMIEQTFEAISKK
jgi:hypothetical protein